MYFDCIAAINGRFEIWEGKIMQITFFGSHYEIHIKGFSRFWIITGPCSAGWFTCVPDCNAVCFLTKNASYHQTAEKLINVLGVVNGVTAASALAKIADLLFPSLCHSVDKTKI